VRKLPGDLPLFDPMSWWDRLWWHTCFVCEELFKGEGGWKTVVMSASVVGCVETMWCCGKCCTTAEVAEATYRREGFG
jgi:hypothetical protein